MKQVLLFFLMFCLSLPLPLHESKATLSRWIDENGDRWEKNAETIAQYLHDNDLTQLTDLNFEKWSSEEWAELFTNTRLDSVFFDPLYDEFTMVFRGSNDFYTSYKVMYSSYPLQDIASHIDLLRDGDPRILTDASESSQLWSGGGMDGNGYLLIERIKENWFYIEIYYRW